MDKLKMHSVDKVRQHIEQIRALFPNCVTEAKNDKGETTLAVDFDMLRQELSDVVVEGPKERYQFTWPDKRKSVLAANAPIAKTLRPYRDESVNFDTTENLYIEGDNLDVLKLLQETYLGKVKMIYIDPPYNTGNDFVYEDDFSESAEEYILDFFSGSATTAHAVMQLNAEDGGYRKFIMVQLPELTDEKSEAYKAGYKNICEIGKERIRRAGAKIKEENPLTTHNLDVGFRVLKVDSTNMQDVYYNPATIQQGDLLVLADNIKPDRTAEDLLFQIMLDLGILLSSKIEQTSIGGKTVYSVADGYLLACFDSGVTDEVVTEVAKRQPYYFVMRDSSLANDATAANFDQIFQTYSPTTVRKVL